MTFLSVDPQSSASPSKGDRVYKNSRRRRAESSRPRILDGRCSGTIAAVMESRVLCVAVLLAVATLCKTQDTEETDDTIYDPPEDSYQPIDTYDSSPDLYAPPIGDYAGTTPDYAGTDTYDDADTYVPPPVDFYLPVSDSYSKDGPFQGLWNIVKIQLTAMAHSLMVIEEYKKQVIFKINKVSAQTIVWCRGNVVFELLGYRNKLLDKLV